MGCNICMSFSSPGENSWNHFTRLRKKPFEFDWFGHCQVIKIGSYVCNYRISPDLPNYLLFHNRHNPEVDRWIIFIKNRIPFVRKAAERNQKSRRINSTISRFDSGVRSHKQILSDSIGVACQTRAYLSY